MRLTRVVAILGLTLLGTACARVNAESASGAYCAYSGGAEGNENCGYNSLRQCLAAVSGVGGACRPNPRGGYIDAPDRRRRVFRRDRD
jgi:hypothetical protein